MKNNINTPELLPCPFCGSDQIQIIFDYGDGYSVGCKSCSTYVSPFLGSDALNKQKHIDFWNRRSGLMPLKLALIKAYNDLMAFGTVRSAGEVSRALKQFEPVEERTNNQSKGKGT
jgi:hypothetical protein